MQEISGWLPEDQTPEKSAAAVKSTWISVKVNFGLTGVQLGAGVVSGSHLATKRDSLAICSVC